MADPKALLMNAVKDWAKFTAERDKMKTIATEVASITRKLVAENLAFLKTQNIDAQFENHEAMKILGVPIQVDPVVEATFPTVKASVTLKCGGANRAIVINPNATISAAGPPFPFENFKKGIPETFLNNAAEFVSDAFLNAARTGGVKE
ncbi:MAG TPA: hypothetical protein VMM57_04975 [Bacteroidota bacterium]|nr:hypothetical protein [Bacteroidota bacterium]